MLRFLIHAVLCVAALGAMGTVSAAEADQKDAVRVLIDVSGSMKKTDPSNLRAPALRLLVNLLPPDSDAGIWHFATQVNRVTPVGPADSGWRQQALDAADKIHSRGQFTDIGAALKDATADWREPSSAERRSIILLTDGKVDVSKEAGANEGARKALISQLLPRLQSSGVHVHTIALSGDADQSLMKRLAAGTDGEFFQADDAEELERIFLKLFEKTVERETVPLEGNRFQIDDQINEMTVLAFRAPDAEPTQLARPDGTTYGHQDAPDNARWFEERGYDLITVDDPQTGEWRLIADTDPDNRVMIITDLKLHTSRLPTNMIAGEKVTLEAGLREEGELITREDFLSVVEFTVTQDPEQGSRGQRWVLHDRGDGDDAKARDGIYSLALDESLTEGKHLIVTRAESATFEREDRQRLTVHSQPLDIQEVADDTAKSLVMTPEMDWIEPGSLQLTATVTRADGTSRQAEPSADEKGIFTLPLPESGNAIPVKVTLDVAGRTTAGREFAVTLSPRTVMPLETASPPPEDEEPSDGPPPEEKPTNWAFIGAVVMAVNVAVFGLLGLGYLLWSNRRKSDNEPEFGTEDAEAIHEEDEPRD